MQLIIDIDDEMYKRICEAQSVPDMYGTDVVNAINRIKTGTPCNQIATICNQSKASGKIIVLTFINAPSAVIY